MQEFDRIARYFAPLAQGAEGAFGLTDDAAQLTAPHNEPLVITQDTLIESVHFTGAEPPATIAQKALRTNLSDLAAKGATPLAYFLSLSLPARCDDNWLEQFCHGLAHDQQQYGIHLMGGDSTTSPAGIVMTITAIGHSPAMLRRNGAQAGDKVYLTGTVGDATLGLRLATSTMATEDSALHALPHGAQEALLQRYQLPQPRVALIPALRRYATASMDVSDGLLQDARHLARQSGITMALALETIPLSAAARAYLDAAAPLTEALLALVTGGDDYEILFTAPASCHEALLRDAAAAGVAITAIGECLPLRTASCAEGGNLVISHEGKAMTLPARLGYTHGK